MGIMACKRVVNAYVLRFYIYGNKTYVRGVLGMVPRGTSAMCKSRGELSPLCWRILRTTTHGNLPLGVVSPTATPWYPVHAQHPRKLPGDGGLWLREVSGSLGRA